VVPVLARELEGVVQQRLQELPLLRCDAGSRLRHALLSRHTSSERRNSIRALAQSRCTVRTVTSSAFAVSSSEKPPKKRNSTTRQRSGRGTSSSNSFIAPPLTIM